MASSMDWSQAIQTFLSSQSALLPLVVSQQVYLRLGWGLVLAALTLWILQRVFFAQSRHALKRIAAAVFLLTLLPGPVSPAYWLGLAFAAPSLVSTGLAVLVLQALLKGRASGLQAVSAPASSIASNMDDRHHLSPLWLGLGLVLGGVLLLDTFAVFPISIYALGFGSAALGVTLLLVALMWAAGGMDRAHRTLVYVFVVVLAVFIGLRLPSGNLWDALIDPGLWLVLVLTVTSRSLCWLRSRLQQAP